ncbi:MULTISPECIES: hypothetical protein [unclassified Streptomyces]|uniref:hypothetical protein n=1 Tax=unclassified Streptomyces TaxID=2593676 RepID=UPI00331E4A5E
MSEWSTALNGPEGASESALDALDRLAEATRPAAPDRAAGIEARYGLVGGVCLGGRSVCLVRQGQVLPGGP